jgi:hypothetical protein
MGQSIAPTGWREPLRYTVALLYGLVGLLCMNIGFAFLPHPFSIGVTLIMLPLGMFWMGAGRQLAVRRTPTFTGKCMAVVTVLVALVVLRYQLEAGANELLAWESQQVRKAGLWLPGLVAFSAFLYVTWPSSASKPKPNPKRGR